MASLARPFAMVTGASSGIGYELAKQCRDNGFDLLIAADGPEIEQSAATLRQHSAASVEAVQADLSGMQGRGDVVAGWHNKLQAAIAHIAPAGVLAEMHKSMAEPQR